MSPSFTQPQFLPRLRKETGQGMALNVIEGQDKVKSRLGILGRGVRIWNKPEAGGRQELRVSTVLAVDADHIHFLGYLESHHKLVSKTGARCSLPDPGAGRQMKTLGSGRDSVPHLFPFCLLGAHGFLGWAVTSFCCSPLLCSCFSLSLCPAPLHPRTLGSALAPTVNPG